MNTNLSTHSMQQDSVQQDSEKRRSGNDRRDDADRRRSSSGLFELRARREAPAGDRRSRRDRRDSLWARIAFWRRDKVDTGSAV